MKFWRGQHINPILLMNRAGHRVMQRIGPNTLAIGSGGQGRCFFIERAVIGDPYPGYVIITFNENFDQVTCAVDGDWSFGTLERGVFDNTDYSGDEAPNQGRYECFNTISEGGENRDPSPQERVWLTYAPGTCRKDGSTEDECLLPAYTQYPVTNRTLGPKTLRVGDIADNLIIITFEGVDLVSFGDINDWGVSASGGPINETPSIVNGDLHLTLSRDIAQGETVTVTHHYPNPGLGAQADDGRFVYYFDEMPVNNVVGVSFWKREDDGPWLLDHETGRWQLE